MFMQLRFDWNDCYLRLRLFPPTFAKFMCGKVNEHDISLLGIFFVFNKSLLSSEQLKFCNKIFFTFYDELSQQKHFMFRRPQFFCVLERDKLILKKKFLLIQASNPEQFFYPVLRDIEALAKAQMIVYLQRNKNFFFQIYFHFQVVSEKILLMIGTLQFAAVIFFPNGGHENIFYFLQIAMILAQVFFNFLLKKKVINEELETNLEENSLSLNAENNSTILRNNYLQQFYENFESLILLFIVIMQKFSFIFFPLQILFQLKISLITKQLFFAITQKIHVIILMYFIIIIFVYMYVILI
jgi:hypothetical protein